MRLIDGDKLLEWLRSQDSIVDMIDSLSMEFHDIPRVIRCKDCRHYQFVSYGYCNGGLSGFGEVIMEPNDYCSYAERRED